MRVAEEKKELLKGGTGIHFHVVVAVVEILMFEKDTVTEIMKAMACKDEGEKFWWREIWDIVENDFIWNLG